jgi:hypothetical protein
MDKGRVKSDTGLNLREKPNGEKIAVLRHNEEVDILDEVTFYRVKRAQGNIGYVHGAFLEIMPGFESDSPTPPSDTALPSETFRLVTFSNENFVGAPVKIDNDFVAAMNRVGQYAKNCGLKIWITSSTRSLNNQVKGAIVPPASKSCHHIGHAIDMNVMYDGKLYNSKKLRRGNLANLPEPIRNFIDSIRADKELRWGGDFNTEDPVHIDDDLYRKQEVIYMAKLYCRLDQLNA